MVAEPEHLQALLDNIEGALIESEEAASGPSEMRPVRQQGVRHGGSDLSAVVLGFLAVGVLEERWAGRWPGRVGLAH